MTQTDSYTLRLIRDEITTEAYKSQFAQVLLEQDLFNLVARSLFIFYTREIGYPLDPSILGKQNYLRCLTGLKMPL